MWVLVSSSRTLGSVRLEIIRLSIAKSGCKNHAGNSRLGLYWCVMLHFI